MAALVRTIVRDRYSRRKGSTPQPFGMRAERHFSWPEPNIGRGQIEGALPPAVDVPPESPHSRWPLGPPRVYK